MKNRRIIISRNGGPEVLKLIEESVPSPAEGEVRVRVQSAGVAFADIMMREGIYPGAPPVPFTPGYDIVGLVDEPGAGVKGLAKGQRVAALTKVGGYADYLCLPEKDLVEAPEGLDPAEAVCLVLNYMTAWQMLHRVAHVREGEKILIHGAAGGVGTALLQLGALDGLEMYGTASKSKHEVVRHLGGVPIDYTDEDFVARIKELTVKGVDAVFDPIGGDNWKRSFSTLRHGGRLVVYGYYGITRGGRKNLLAGLKALKFGWKFSPSGMIGRTQSIGGYSITSLKSVRHDWYREDLSGLLGMLAAGKIKPLVAGRLPLEQAAKAHELLGGKKIAGKVVLICE